MYDICALCFIFGSMRSIRKIVLHYSATRDTHDVSAADIDKWHKRRGWRMIGYHYVVRLSGEVEVGRPEDMVGAHVKGHNHDSIGVCFIGGLKGDSKRGSNTMNAAQEQTVISLLKDLLERYPDAKLYGHKDLNATQCPGFDVAQWAKEWNIG